MDRFGNTPPRSETPEKRPTSLRNLLVTLFGFIFLFTYVGMGLFMINYLSQTESALWRGRLREAAQNASEKVSQLVHSSFDVLKLMAVVDPAIRRDNPHLLDRALDKNPEFLEIILVDDSGNVVDSASRDHVVLANLFTTRQASWFRSAEAGEDFMGPFQTSYTGSSYLILAVPAQDGGVMAARLNMQVLNDVLASIRVGAAGRALVTDEDGNILVHSDEASVSDTVNLSDQPYFMMMLAKQDQEWYGFYQNLAGIPVAGASLHVPETPWIILTELPSSEIYATTRLSFLIGTAVLLGFLLVVYIFMRLVLEERLFGPMQRLNTGVQRIAQGNLAYRIDMSQQDEIGVVATAFNEMAERLSEREQQLQSLNTQLENRVAERTLALAKANQELQIEVIERRRITDQQIILYEVLAAMSEEHDLDGVARVAVDAIESYTGYPHVCLVLPDEDGQHWSVVGAAGSLSATVGTRRRMDEGVIGRVFASGETQMVGDVTLDPDYVLDADGQLGSELAAPLRRGERLLGVLNLESDKVQDFTMEDCWFVEYLADAVALAVENCQLLNAAQLELDERRRVAEQLQASLHEKDVLLQEVHHRVKNNLQVVSSMLSLQARQVNDPRYAELFQESQNRVMSMALIHEKLYRSKDLAQVDFTDYVRNLANELFQAYSVDRQAITLQVTADEEIFLAVDAAIPCGLIINELISNALKHAFHDRRQGEILIHLGRDATGALLLEVADDGCGLPAGLDLRQSRSLGLRLVTTLVDQLHGETEVHSNQGTTFRFKLRID